VKLAIARLCVAAVVASLGLVGLEFALRAAAPEGFLEEPYRMWMVRDPFSGWRNAPGFENSAFRINSLGFRGEEVAPKKVAETIRIVSLGDSGTFGLWHAESADSPGGVATRFDAHYPGEVAKALSGHVPPVEVLNAGVVAYTSSHGLRLFISRVLDLEPDIVTVRFLWNDHEPAFEPQLSAADPDHALGQRALETLRDSMLLRLGLRAYQSVDFLHTAPEGGRWIDLDRYESNLHRFAEISRRHGIHLLFIDYPLRPLGWGVFPSDAERVETGGYESVADIHVVHERYHAVLRRVAEDEGVPIVESARRLRERPPSSFTTVDIVHPNQRGARVLGESIAEKIQELGWLDGS
jgi:lysophospholipase L1-like esterase